VRPLQTGDIRQATGIVKSDLDRGIWLLPELRAKRSQRDFEYFLVQAQMERACPSHIEKEWMGWEREANA
jgi:hypothetical protein